MGAAWLGAMAASPLNLPPTAGPHPDTEVPTLGGRGKSPSLIINTDAINKGQGRLAGHFSLGNFQVT